MAKKRGGEKYRSCDPLAMAVAIDPDIVTSSTSVWCDIEVSAIYCKDLGVCFYLCSISQMVA